MALNSSLKFRSREAAAISSCQDYIWAGVRWAEVTYQSDFVILKILEPCVECLSWRDENKIDELDPNKEKGTDPREFEITRFPQRARSWVWRCQEHRRDVGNRRSSRQGCCERAPWTDENSCSRSRRLAWVKRLDSEGEEKPFKGEKARLLEGI